MKSIAVIGAGESGVGAALLAIRNNVDVFVSDFGTIADRYKQELIKNNIPFEERGHDFERIEKADVIVKSPGIPGSADVIRYFRLRHKPVISEIEFASRYYDGRIISITGSNGKTTTTKLCYHILAQSGMHIGMGGNVGVSFARLLSQASGFDWVVLELSSFQLEDIDRFRSDISVILNITPDHLDRYDYNFLNYARAKWNLAQHTMQDGLLILNKSNPVQLSLSTELPVKVPILWLEEKNTDQLVSKETAQTFDMEIKGYHNEYNASVAVCIARRLDIPEEKIASGLASFKAVEHRLETVARQEGIEFINDSKSTNVDSSLVALDALPYPVVWIAGGKDKGNDYSRLDDLVRSRVSAIVCLTTDDSNLKKQFSYFGDRLVTTQDVDEAVRLATGFIDEGTVLLSPACASFDLFDNYEHRGNSFKNAVHKYLNDID